MGKLLVLLLFIGLSSCAIFNSTHYDTRNYNLNKGKQFSKLRRAVRARYNKDVDLTRELLEEFIKNEGPSIYDAEVNFQLGLAYIEYRDWEEAKKYFRQASQLWRNHQAPRIKALYQLSLCHEQLGEDTLLIADLKEIELFKKFLPKDVLYMEIPARLASAYAREGNHKQAKLYYEMAENQLKYFISQANTDPKVRAIASKTLYNIGYMAYVKSDKRKFKDHILAVKHGQSYLLRAIEFGDKDWAVKSLKQFDTIYRETIDSIKLDEQEKHAGDVVELREIQKLKKDQMLKLHSILMHLKAEALPAGIKDNTYLDEFNNSYDTYNKEILAYINTRDYGDGLSESAIELNSLKRNYKLKSAEDKAKQKIPDSEDPNL